MDDAKGEAQQNTCKCISSNITNVCFRYNLTDIDRFALFPCLRICQTVLSLSLLYLYWSDLETARMKQRIKL